MSLDDESATHTRAPLENILELDWPLGYPLAVVGMVVGGFLSLADEPQAQGGYAPIEQPSVLR